MSDAPRQPLKLVIRPEPEPPSEPTAPPRAFTFKPTEFERANRPADGTPGNAPIDVQQIYRAGASPARVSRGQSENEVHAILRANLAKAEAKGLGQIIVPARRSSRRKRDYCLLLISGNALIAGVLSVLPKNPVTLTFGFGAMVFGSLALTWLMWFVIDEY